MSSKLNRHAYENLIAEDIEWLLKQPRTLEREHIVAVLRCSPDREYARPEAPRIPAGWKLVPLVPTDEMEKAAAHEDNRYSNNRFTFASESRFFNLYAAMLRTAPEAAFPSPLRQKP